MSRAGFCGDPLVGPGSVADGAHAVPLETLPRCYPDQHLSVVSDPDLMGFSCWNEAWQD